MLLRNISVALVSAALMSACGSPKDANKANFAKAINAELASSCFSIGGEGFAEPYPKVIDLNVPREPKYADEVAKKNAEETAPYEALVKVGLLKVEETQDKTMTMFAKEELIPAKKYSLTEAGTAALRRPRHDELCAGHYRVDEVVSFTEPAANMMGQVVSGITYTYSPADVAPWAKDPAVQAAYPDLVESLKPHQQATKAAMLQNDGWVAEKQMSIFD